jgi:hypothetical protein
VHLQYLDESCAPVAKPHFDHYGEGLMPLCSPNRGYHRLQFRSHDYDDVSSTRRLEHNIALWSFDHSDRPEGQGSY